MVCAADMGGLSRYFLESDVEHMLLECCDSLALSKVLLNAFAPRVSKGGRL